MKVVYLVDVMKMPRLAICKQSTIYKQTVKYLTLRDCFLSLGWSKQQILFTYFVEFIRICFLYLPDVDFGKFLLVESSGVPKIYFVYVIISH